MSFAETQNYSRPHAADYSRETREVRPFEDLRDYLSHYARTKPAAAALICLGVGFMLGWKLKPW